ncbi:MAG: hypothetical protein ACRCUP_00700 [Mycoplasmatales bacterium]
MIVKRKLYISAVVVLSLIVIFSIFIFLKYGATEHKSISELTFQKQTKYLMLKGSRDSNGVADNEDIIIELSKDFSKLAEHRLNDKSFNFGEYSTSRFRKNEVGYVDVGAKAKNNIIVFNTQTRKITVDDYKSIVKESTIEWNSYDTKKRLFSTISAPETGFQALVDGKYSKSLCSVDERKCKNMIYDGVFTPPNVMTEYKDKYYQVSNNEQNNLSIDIYDLQFNKVKRLNSPIESSYGTIFVYNNKLFYLDGEAQKIYLLENDKFVEVLAFSGDIGDSFNVIYNIHYFDNKVIFGIENRPAGAPYEFTEENGQYTFKKISVSNDKNEALQFINVTNSGVGMFQLYSENANEETKILFYDFEKKKVLKTIDLKKEQLEITRYDYLLEFE